MDVLASVERLNQCRVFGKMGQNPKLDLRVVRCEKLPAVCEIGNERLSNLSTKFCPNRNVLYVRIVA